MTTSSPFSTRPFRVKPLPVVGFALIIGFGIYGANGLKGSITPYVTIAQARSTPDRVQVKGSLDKSTLHTDSLGRLIFDLTDFKTHERFTVMYCGEDHANMAMARDVVAMGNWNPKSGVFNADQMNIKCPDKYQTGTDKSPAAPGAPATSGSTQS